MTPKEQEIREEIESWDQFADESDSGLDLGDCRFLLSIIDSLRADLDEARGLLILQWQDDSEKDYLEKYLTDKGIISLKASAIL